MKKIGVVGVPDGWSSERLADAVNAKTGFRLLIDLEDIHYDSERETVYSGDIDLRTLDALIIKKVGPRYSPDLLNRLELLRFLEMKGVPCFSPATSIINSFNRLNNTLNLQLAGIPMPPTTITENVDQAVETVQRYGKAIFKPLFSTKARGMEVINKEDNNLIERIKAFKENGNVSMYIQKMIDIPGKDLGVAFLGGKYLTTYARVKQNDSWNTTTNSGGKYEPHDPGEEIIELARKAQEVFKLDFTSVDVVETEEGPMVFEVSAFGGFRGLLEAQNIDAADLYAQHAIERIS